MKILVLAILTAVMMFNITYGQNSLRIKHINLEKGVAIQGYDPVAYFTQNKAVKGFKQFATIAEGITYYFSSAVNKEIFKKGFKKYEPQYGGWCAYAMATNEKVEIDPETFKITDGKLFLFYHSWVNNTLPKWNKDENSLHAKADENWYNLFR